MGRPRLTPAQKKKADQRRAERRRELAAERKAEREAAEKLDAYFEVTQNGVAAILGGEERGIEQIQAKSAKQALQEAFELLGGVVGLVEFGKRYRKEFYMLWGRLIPRATDLELGDNTLEALLGQLPPDVPDDAPSVQDAAEQIAGLLVRSGLEETVQ